MELGHLVSSHLSDLGHLRQLLWVAGEEVEEGQAVEVLGALVGDLDDLSDVVSFELKAMRWDTVRTLWLPCLSAC